MIDRYMQTLDQMKKTRDLIRSFNTADYRLSSFATILDSEINRTEETIQSIRGKTAAAHRCDFCDRGYNEDEPVFISSLKICPSCRAQGPNYQIGSVLEVMHGLPAGTIKRDCSSISGKPPKLQKFIDAGLIYKSGNFNMVHVRVIDLYYNDESQYHRRSSRKQRKH